MPQPIVIDQEVLLKIVDALGQLTSMSEQMADIKRTQDRLDRVVNFGNSTPSLVVQATQLRNDIEYIRKKLDSMDSAQVLSYEVNRKGLWDLRVAAMSAGFGLLGSVIVPLLNHWFK